MAKKTIIVKNMKQLAEARVEQLRQVTELFEDGILIEYARGFNGEGKNKAQDPSAGCPKCLVTKQVR